MSWSQLGEGDGESEGHEIADGEDDDVEYEDVLSANERLVGVVQVLLLFIGAATGRSLGRLALSEMPFPV